MEINAYELRIHKAIEIPAVVYQAMSEAHEEKTPQHVLLRHHEAPNVVRGRKQNLRHNDLESEVRRPDPGGYWYHGPTHCYIIAEPIEPKDTKKFTSVQENWAGRLIELVRENTQMDGIGLKHRGGDIYVERTGPQMFGLSSLEVGDVRVQRACWYTKDPMEEIIDLLKRDEQDVDNFRRSVVKGPTYLLDGLSKSMHAEIMDASDYISKDSMQEALDLQEPAKKSGREYACVTG